MALGSGIEWTESTWNPVTGCNKLSPGCKYCYAERMAERLQAMGQPNYRNGFALTLQPQMLRLPLQWRKPQTIFVNSMSDLFHKDVPLAYIQRVFDVMRRAHWHRFQVLTKRAERLAAISSEIDWPANVWMGVSVENADYVERIDDLRATGARVAFFFKQWGGKNKKKAGRILDGRTWDEMPKIKATPRATSRARSRSLP